MRFFQPDLNRYDGAGIHRWNDPVAASMFHFLFIYHQHFFAKLNGISAIVSPARRYVDTDDPRPPVLHCNIAWQGVAP
jgi:hypothetical protein